jgi:Trypsin-like peptidase domain
MLMRRQIAGVLGVSCSVMVAAALWSAGSVAAVTQVAPETPTARSFDGLPSVGPLFRDGLGQPHDCTASVVASPGRDLILTAAHCISGTGAGYLFVPGYDKGATPHGVWTVTHAYVDPRWISVQDPRDDIAILQVAVQQRGSRTVSVQDVTGANYLLPRPRPGQSITAVAYNFGIDDQPITCTIPVYYTGGYPSFGCHGYVGGSSGSPWLTTVAGTHVTFVRGVTGGLHQGGCFEYTSYSAPLGANVYRLLARATVGDVPDTLPPAGSDGC